MRDTLDEYRKLIAWQVLRHIAARTLGVAGLYLLASWVAMAVGGAISRELGGASVSYVVALVAVGALWAIVAPLIWMGFKLYVPPEPSPWPDRRPR